MLGKIIASSTVIALVALLTLLVWTIPSSIGPLGILAVFGLIYVSALGVMTFLLYGVNMAVSRASRMIAGKVQASPLSLRKAYYYASVLTLGPVMLVAMQSVNEIGIYQVSLVVLFVGIAWMYIKKRTS